MGIFEALGYDVTIPPPRRAAIVVTESQTKAMNLYVGMMEEVNIRIACINVALAGRTLLPDRAVMEFCLLQLRMLCELIALGCLVVHGDIDEKKANSLKKEWSADKIIKELDGLHPDFYPHPVLRKATKPGHYHLEEITSGYLTKKELLELLGLTGDALHRGSLKNILSVKRAMEPGLPGIAAWGNKIVKLLGDHRMALIDNRTHFICALNANNVVQVAIAESPLPGALGENE